MTPNRLSIIIPSKNVENLKSCVRAIRKLDESATIIVVADGLHYDAIPDYDLYVSGDKPFCFSRNVNIGIRQCPGDDVVILNDDALLETPGGFTALQSAWKEEPGWGLVSAATNNTGNPNQAQRYNLSGDAKYFIREDPRMVCFVAVFIPRSTINAVGLLDESFTGYEYEDDDYCLRVRQAGLKIGIFDGCVVDHTRLKPTYRGTKMSEIIQLNGLTEHNRKIFIAKHGKDRLEV